MLKTIKFLNLLTIFLFILSLLGVYSYANQEIIMDIYPGNKLIISKNTFFYYTLMIFLVINVLYKIMDNLLIKSLIHISLKNLAIWIALLPIILNFSLFLLLVYIGAGNNTMGIQASQYQYLNIIVVFIIIIWLVGLLINLLHKKKDVSIF